MCQPLRLEDIRRLKEPCSPHRGIEPSACVKARAHDKSDVIGIHRAKIHTAFCRQLPESQTVRVLHAGKSFLYKDPVLSGEIHDITHGRKGCIGQHLIFGITAQCEDQLPCDPCTAQLLVGIRAVLLFCVDDTVTSLRKLKDFMMVCHDHRHAELFP